MVVLTNTPVLDHISLVEALVHSKPPLTYVSGIPVIDMSKPESSRYHLVRACEELGFFKVVNHGVPMEVMSRLEEEATRFFSMPQAFKDRSGPATPYGYGSKRIGPNGDVGWVEYLLMQVNSKPTPFSPFLPDAASENLLSALKDYIEAVKKLTNDVLEMMADGLGIPARDAFSRLVAAGDSDCMFRINHYPPLPKTADRNLTGFGEHTDPQIISALRSNETTGLQIELRDGTWVPVAPDHTSFFINVGDSLQVLTNGRFKSVRHRVIANSHRSRVSMIYFGAPTCGARITPLPLLMGEGEQSHYREFTWSEYKSSAYKSKLADNRLALFEKHH